MDKKKQFHRKWTVLSDNRTQTLGIDPMHFVASGFEVNIITPLAG